MTRSQTLAANVVDVFSPLQDWVADVGLATGGHVPGITVGGIRYRLSVDNTLGTGGNQFFVFWGFIVTNEMITTAADFSPSAKQHLDWMEWGAGSVGAALAAAQPLAGGPGGGDDGFRTTRARRRVKEVEDDLVFAIVASTGITYRLVTSVAVMLP